MPAATDTHEGFRRGLLGMYALAVMEKEGAVHGYRVAERVAERTEGAWRPGPGAVYPALKKLVDRGHARPRARPAGRRREFEITPQGRAFLHRLRSHGGWAQRARMDLAPLWAEIAGVEGLDEFLLLRLRRVLDGLESYLSTHPGAGGRSPDLRNGVEQELTRFLERLHRPVARGSVYGRAAPGGRP